MRQEFEKSKKVNFKWLAIGIPIVLILIFFSVFYVKDPVKEIPEEGAKQETPNDQVKDGIHIPTGLKDGEGLMTVVTHCTACHSAQLITQNRMNKERWNATIRWMQETQNLWELGDNQEVIVNYLVENYPVSAKGRRENLQNIEWYELQE